MIELTADSARDYLIRQGRLSPVDPVEVTSLAGGVSNVVLLVRSRRAAPFVLKQSRSQLRTRADWFSRLERIFREADAQRALSRLLPAGAVPEVLFEDRENYCFAMSAVRSDHAVWKRQLLSGQVVPAVFEGAGRLLADIHARTLGKRDLLADADDTSVFRELRVDPFYRRIADVHPVIQPAVAALIDSMPRHACCLVHADFSPKNLLIHAEGLTLVDYETAHYGDPAFDLGLFFAHLWLKAVAVESARASIIVGIEAAWREYCRQAMALHARFEALVPELSRRAVPHWAACLLARLDGKSPVDYLDDAERREFVRRQALEWLSAGRPGLESAFEAFTASVLSL
jgi:5-methylthioribose kinase